MAIRWALAVRLAPLAGLGWCWHLASQPAGDWRAAGPEAKSIAALLTARWSFSLDDASRQALSRARGEFARGDQPQTEIRQSYTAYAPEELRDLMGLADRSLEAGARAMAEAFQGFPGLVDLGGQPARVTLETPLRKGLVFLARRGRDHDAPRFVWRKVPLPNPPPVEIPTAGPFFAVLEIENAPEGTAEHRIAVTAEGGFRAELTLSTVTPPRIPLTIDLRDENGRATEAAVAVYSARGELAVSETALSFASAGYSYEPEVTRDHGNARFWPGRGAYRRCFYERGRFRVEVPAGDYRLMVTKGPEYRPVDRSFHMEGPVEQRVALRRWIDLSAQGWHSGDCHLHFERPTPAANDALVRWTQAEDLRMSNILRMGDAKETYFEQYAFGPAGRFVHPRGALVSGQEDPRTNTMGHTIQLNLREPVRDVLNYYLYAPVYAAVRAQGGVSGYAHVNRGLFIVRRDMTLNVPRGLVDFAELAEFGNLDTPLYYEFLNLGFRLPVAGGSDVPWGGTAGDARTYVYTGGRFSPDAWFQGLKAGRTFVTFGPLLDFTVDGQLPGSALDRKAGDRLKVRARLSAGYPLEKPERLEVIVNGDPVRSSESGEVRFEMFVRRSFWIAARTKSAHTSPVYVTIEGQRHWNGPQVDLLLDRRARDLAGLERLVERTGSDIQPGGRGNWEDRFAFQHSLEGLREAIAEARKIYSELAAEPR